MTKHFAAKILDPQALEQLIALGRELEQIYPKFPWKFIQGNKTAHPKALIEVLKVLKWHHDNKVALRKGPFALANHLLPRFNGKWNGRDAERAHEVLKEQMKDMKQVKPEIYRIAERLFGGVV
jgi:hypothetical protein